MRNQYGMTYKANVDRSKLLHPVDDSVIKLCFSCYAPASARADKALGQQAVCFSCYAVNKNTKNLSVTDFFHNKVHPNAKIIYVQLAFM